MNDDNAVETVRHSLTTARNSLTDVHMTTPLDTIVRDGRSRRRLHSLTGLAGAAVVAVGTGLAVAAVLPASPAPASGIGTVRTAAFTLAEHANGTATLTLTAPVLLDPSALQRDLRQDGIPAVVRAGSFCSSHSIPSGFTQVVSEPDFASYTINPAAMPVGTELSFGTEQIPNPAAYANRPSGTETSMELIDTDSYTCSSALPQPHPCSEGANVEYLPGIHGGVVEGCVIHQSDRN
jgi:hypothetical protein